MQDFLPANVLHGTRNLVLWSSMNEEFERTQEWVLKISGQPELLSNNPGIKASIALRENIVLSLLVIQQYALISLREKDQ